MPIATCKNLCVSYGSYHALNNVTLDINNGDYVSVVGTNGSGKTTFVKALLGLSNVVKGCVRLSSNFIGYLPQSTSIKRNFPATIDEVVMSGAAGRKLFFNKNDRLMALLWIKQLGLSDLIDKSFGQLSGGQKQRVLLARSLVALNLPLDKKSDDKTRLLILDEPVTGLDTIVTDDLYSTLSHLHKTFGVTIIMVSHDVARAVENASHILHLSRGVVAYFGATDDYKKSDIFHKIEHVEVCHG